MSIIYDNVRPTILGDTLNKKTPSKKANEIRYEYSNLPQENRVFVESVINDVQKSKMPSGYDGTPVIKDVIIFEEEYPCLSWKTPDLLYDKMMNDARNVFPRNRDLKLKVNEYYTEMIRINLNNIYHNAPRFFTDNFMPKAGVNNAAFEAYQVYIYLLCFIYYTDNHRNDVEIRELDNIETILNWIATRRDPSIGFIISGPVSNSNLMNNDFRAHYKTLISPSNDMSEIIQYNQLSTSQTISTDLYNLLNFIQNAPNVYIKTPDEARKYNINIDSAKGVLVKIDGDNNLVFDCNNVNLGDTTEQNKLAKYSNLDTVITNNVVNSMINTKKLAELFHNYSRIKVLELIISPDTYITSLDVFRKVFIVFKGISCSERNIYNTIPTNYLKIGGTFKRTSRGFEFIQDVDAITYKSVLADVKAFEIYLTVDPSMQNQIIPNEYALAFTKDKVYQHPIETGVQYNPTNKSTLRSFDPENMVTHNVINPSFDMNSNKQLIKGNELTDIQNRLNNISDAQTLKNAINYCLVFIRNLNNTIGGNSPLNPFLTKFSSLLGKILDKLDELENNSKLDSDLIELNRILNLDSDDVTLNDLLNSFDANIILNIFKLFINKNDPDWSNVQIRKVQKELLVERFENVGVKMENIKYNEVTNEFISLYDNINIDILSKYFNLILGSINPNGEEIITEENNNGEEITETIPFVSSFDDLYKQLQFYTEIYSILISLVINEKDSTKVQVKKQYKYKNVFVDTSTGKINGKYFRIDSQGDVKFTDSNGKEYSTPNNNFLIYSEQENDLCLYNLYKNFGEETNILVNGTYLYSENLKTIQNLSYILPDYTRTNDLIRFDNIFSIGITRSGNEEFKIIYPDNAIFEEHLLQDNSVTKWDEIDGIDDDNFTYYKIITKTEATSGQLSNTEYTFVEINNNTLVSREESDPSGDLAILINGFVNDDIKAGEDIYYGNNQKITVTYYKVNSGFNGINMYYKYYNPYLYFIYETNEWSIDIILNNHEDITNQYELTESNITFTTEHLAYNPNEPDASIQNVACTINSNMHAFCNIYKIDGEFRIFGLAYSNEAQNKTPIGVLYGYSANIQNIENNINEYDTFGGTFNGNIYNSSYGSFNKITITDQFGNNMSVSETENGQRNISIINEMFNSLDELIDNPLSQKNKDSSNNTVIVQYSYDPETKVLTIKNSKEISLDQSILYDIMIFDMNTISLIQYNYTYSTSNKTITNASFKNLVYSTQYFNTEFENNVFLNSYFLNKLVGYENDMNTEKSCCFKAYNIDGIDIKNTYWNGLMYINSILLCSAPINNSLKDATIPLPANESDIHGLSFNTSDTNIYLYNYKNGVMNTFSGNYIITQTDILKYENDVLGSSGLDSLFVSKSGLQTFSFNDRIVLKYSDASEEINRNIIKEDIYLYDDNLDARYKITVFVENSVISKYTLFEKRVLLAENIDGSFVERNSKYVFVGEYRYATNSRVPTYVEDCEVIFTFKKEESLLIKQIVISSVSLSRTIYDVKEYVKTATGMKERVVYTMKYSNIPGKYINNADRFTISIPNMVEYKIHPVIKYFENSLVSPKYVDQNGKYITVVEKYNQNIITGPVYIRSQYSIGSDDYSIGNKINPYTEHILESINQKYVMIGNMNKTGSMGDIAIRSNEIFAIPISSKMLLSLEFS